MLRILRWLSNPKGAALPSAAPARDGLLAGKVVTIVHPAWHSCGSHQVFVSQARAYRSLGATVVSLAVADTPGSVDGSASCKAYFAASGDLEADIRLYAGMPLQKIVNAGFLAALSRWLRGNYAAMRVEIAKLAALPVALASLPRIDLIHCNHFFCMAVATRLRDRAQCPILLDTHDLQARQYALRHRGGLTLPPAASFEDMLKIEIEAMQPADILVHLNDEEAAAFQKLVPEKRHALLYPTVKSAEVGPGGEDFIIIASANHANVLSLVWFLEEVMPLAPGVPVKILGNIDQQMRSHAPSLYRAYAPLFLGRVGDLHAAYGKAAGVLLPATAGHGISIKMIEALSSGAPLIATPLAFRGSGLDAAHLSNVTVAETAAQFAAAMRLVFANRHQRGADRKTSPTRRIYEKQFAFAAYRQALLNIVEQILKV
ncbi:glycosyl transferase family 1 [Beijerinckiaceae bacterium]|nr:glycosyl transferase family 1 [Beijerinckiaceae bacterium]